MPKSSRSSFPASTVEWIASLYMAALPVTSAAPNLQIAIATLPAIAAMMPRTEPDFSATPPPPLRRRYVITTDWPLSAVALGCRSCGALLRRLSDAGPLRVDRSHQAGIRNPSRLADPVASNAAGSSRPFPDIRPDASGTPSGGGERYLAGLGHGLFKVRPGGDFVFVPPAVSNFSWTSFAASVRSAPVRLAPVRLASVRSAPIRLARYSKARVRLARVRLAPVRLARYSLASVRSAPV